MVFYWLVLGILGVWRITHLFYAEDGPWDIFVRLRKLAGSGFWGKLLDCFYCLSLWIAVPFALVLGDGWMERIFLWPTFSAGAILLERATSRLQGTTPAPFAEDAEEQNALLRRQEGTVPQKDPGSRDK